MLLLTFLIVTTTDEKKKGPIYKNNEKPDLLTLYNFAEHEEHELLY
jgi:hypothetical protein